MDELGFPVFDMDHHLYEPPDAIAPRLPKHFANAMQFVDVGGRAKLAVLGKLIDYMPNPTFERVAAPGAHETFYAGKNVDGKTLREMSGRPIDVLPEFQQPAPRLARMDEQGLANLVIYPTLANLVEYAAMDRPDVVHAVIHALNDWLYETWSFDYEGRIFATPVITLALLDEAIAELERVLERGAKIILIRSGPVRGWQGSRSPALPEFDPFWARVEEAGLPVALHAALPPLEDYVQLWEPADSISAFAQSAFKIVALGHREISDMIASLICHGTLSRFPKLRIASVENGSNWVRPLLDELELTYGKMPQNFAEHPVEVFKRNLWVNPFWEADAGELAVLIGADKVMFGSDWPHPEGLAEPLSYVKYLDGLDGDLRRKILSSNAYGFMGLPAPA